MQRLATEQHNQTFRAMAMETLRAYLSEQIAEELAPHMRLIFIVNDDDEITSARVEVNAQAMELAPFELHYRPERSGEGCRWGSSWHSAKSVDIVDTLVAAHEAWPAYEAKQATEAEKRRRQLIDRLEMSYVLTFDDDDISTQHAELMNLDAERAEYLMTARTARIAERQQRAAEHAAWKAEYEQARQGYEAAYAAYWQRRSEILAHNNEVITRWRAQIERPFEVVYIRIGIAGAGESGEWHASTETITTLGQDAEGYWLEIEHGQLHRWKHNSIVSASAPVTIKPGENNHLACALYVGGTEIHGDSWMLYAPPVLDRSEYTTVIDQITAELATLPPEPNNARLSYRDTDAIQRSVQSAAHS